MHMRGKIIYEFTVKDPDNSAGEFGTSAYMYGSDKQEQQVCLVFWSSA